MASVDVKEIISKQGIDSVTKATQELEKGYLVLQDYIVGAKTLNDVLAKSKGMSDFSKNADASAIAQEKLRQSIVKTQALELKLEQQRSAAFAKEEQRQAKINAIEQAQIAKDNAKLKRIADIEARETIRAQKQAQFVEKEIANSQRLTDAETNEATARGKSNVATQQGTSAKKLSNNEQLKAIELERQGVLSQKAFIKESLAVKGSLEQRQLALARLQKTYTLLSAEERSTPFGQRLLKTIPQLNTQVLSLEQSLGKSQRNVGNYSNAFTKGFGKVFGAIRQIAYIVPGLGIAGVLNLAIEPLTELISKLDLFKKTLTTTKVAQDDVAKALAAPEYSKAITDVESLRQNIQLAKDGFISKEGVLKQYNETIGQTTGQVTSLNEAEQELNKNANAFIQFTLLKAAAQIALEDAAKKAYEAEITRRKKLEEFGNSFLDASVTNIRSEAQYKSQQANIIANRKRRQQEEVKISEDAKTQQLSIARDFNAQAAKIAKENNFNFFSDSKTAKPKKAKDNSKELERNARDSAAALVQIELNASKEIQDIYDAQANNEFFSLDARLTSLNNFTEQARRTTQLAAEKELVGKKNTAEEEKLITEKLIDDLEKLDRESGTRRLEIIKQNTEIEKRALIERNQLVLSLIEKQRNEDLTALINAYQKTGDYSKSAQEKLEADKLEITRKANLKIIDEQIQQAQTLIELRKLQGYDTTKNETELSELILRAKELEVDGANKLSDKRLEKEKQNAEKLKEVAQGVFDFARTLTSQLFEGNIANLEEERDIRQKNTDLQLQNIADSTLSEKQKAEQTAIINAQAEQQQAQIDARIREQKRKQAIADKAFALAQIAINTAVAISAALKLPVLGAFVIPSIVALGAIQAATVLAQPIPKFAKGGVMKRDGLAEYGHGRELRIDPDGKTSLTSDTPTVGFVQKGTRFISAPETKRLMAKPDRVNVEGNSWDISGLVAESQLTRKEFKKAISKISVKSTSITEKGFKHQSGRMANISKYIGRNFSRN